MTATKRHLPVRFARNTVSTYLYTVVALVTGVLVTPVLVHHLGTEAYGIWVLAGSVVLYLELFELGFGKTTVTYVARFDAEGDLDGMRATIVTSMFTLAVPGLLALLGGIALAFVFPAVLHVPHGLVGQARAVIMLTAVALALSIPSDTSGGALAALQRYDLLNATLAATVVAQAVGSVAVLLRGGGLVGLALVTTALAVTGQVARYVLVRRIVPGLRLSPRFFRRGLVRPMAGLSFWFAVRDVAKLVVERIDMLVVGLVVGVPAAAVYAIGQKLAGLASRVVFPIADTFFPWSSELSARGDEQGLRDAASVATRVTLGVAGPVCVTAATLARPAVELWVGRSFADASTVVVYLAAATAASALVHPVSLLLQGRGDARPPSLAYALEGVVNLVASVVLARVMGLSGVALGSLIGTLAVQIALFLPYACRRLGLRPLSFVARILAAHLVPLVIALTAWWATGRWSVHLATLAVRAVLIGGGYVIGFWLTGLTRDERRRLRDRLTGGTPLVASGRRPRGVS